MDAFVQQSSKWYDQMLAIPNNQLSALMKMGDKVLALLKFAGGKKAN